MVYLKLLGVELGYLDAKDGKMIGSLLKMIPTDVSTILHICNLSKASNGLNDQNYILDIVHQKTVLKCRQ